jgi:hypothetical protein
MVPAILLQHWGECVFHGVGPDLIALLVRMQQVRHDVPGKCAVRSEEFGTDIHELHRLPVIKKRELDIDFFDLLADRVVCCSARENAEQQDFAFRQPGAQFVDDGRHAFDDFRRGIARFAVVFIARIVRTDEQHNDFWFDALEFAVFDAPERVLGAVVADAELGGVTRRVIFVPDIQPALVPKPAGGDGIAEKQQVNAALLRLLHKGLVARHPIGGKGAGRGNDGGVFGKSRDRQESGKDKCEIEATLFHAPIIMAGNGKSNRLDPNCVKTMV